MISSEAPHGQRRSLNCSSVRISCLLCMTHSSTRFDLLEVGGPKILRRAAPRAGAVRAAAQCGLRCGAGPLRKGGKSSILGRRGPARCRRSERPRSTTPTFRCSVRRRAVHSRSRSGSARAGRTAARPHSQLARYVLSVHMWVTSRPIREGERLARLWPRAVLGFAKACELDRA